MEGDDNVHLLAERLDGIASAMLVTRARNGSLKSRPMNAQRTAFDGALWFFTSVTSEKAEEVTLDDQVCLTYADQAKRQFVSITGRASVVNDVKKARELWTPALREWFENAADPSLRLIRIDVELAECWDSVDGTQIQLVGFTRPSTPANGAADPSEMTT